MRKLLSLLLIVLFPCLVEAQYNVRFYLKEKTAILHDSIYLTGSFSNWDSTINPVYRMKTLRNGEKFIALKLKGGQIEYKFHRGDWLTVEKDFWGWEVPNKVVFIDKDTTLHDSVVLWRDQMLPEKWTALAKNQSDTSRVVLLASLSNVYTLDQYYKVDSAFYYTRQALVLLQKVRSARELREGDQGRLAFFLFNLQEQAAGLLHSLGNYSKALELRLDNLKLAQQTKDPRLVTGSVQNIISDYASMKDYQNQLYYSRLLQQYIDKTMLSRNDSIDKQWSAYKGKAEAFYHLSQLDSAFYYTKRLQHLVELANTIPQLPGYCAYCVQSTIHLLFGNISAGKDKREDAIGHYHNAIFFAYKGFSYPVVALAQEGLAKLYQKEGRIDSALYFAKSSLATLQNKVSIQAWGENTETYLMDVAPLVALLYYESHQPDSAYKYLRLSVDLKDSFYNVDRVRQFQNITFNEAVRQQQQEQKEKIARQEYENRMKLYALVAGMVAVSFVAFLLYKNNRQKQKTNILLQHRNKEVDRQRTKAETALAELKAAQTQLIQQEKMASLGELTAGIAHEIQNPLNFVNNFSDVNSELIEELKGVLLSDKKQEAMLLADEIKDNEAKIKHHGRRADSIVKGMLLHAGASTGKKEPADINKLTNECLRLSYQRMLAKDNTFCATLEKQFDEGIGEIVVMSQEIGRVLLNLFNNAFYAVHEKKRQCSGTFEPKVTVSTKKEGDRVFIIVSDNGTGIPEQVKEKIFQPFFTTKPTGEGTGLGLSLSYDIITKGHGGELKVETKEGEYAQLTVKLPILT